MSGVLWSKCVSRPHHFGLVLVAGVSVFYATWLGNVANSTVGWQSFLHVIIKVQNVVDSNDPSPYERIEATVFFTSVGCRIDRSVVFWYEYRIRGAAFFCAYKPRQKNWKLRTVPWKKRGFRGYLVISKNYYACQLWSFSISPPRDKVEEAYELKVNQQSVHKKKLSSPRWLLHCTT